MITHSAYVVEPWRVRETGLCWDALAQSESVFVLSNGHIGWRGNLEEGEPHGLPGSYLNGVHELHPLPYAEAGYGYPESGQTVINGKLIRLLVDAEPFDLRYGVLRCHQPRGLSADAPLPLLRACTASRRSSRRTWCWRCTCVGTPSPRTRPVEPPIVLPEPFHPPGRNPGRGRPDPPRPTRTHLGAGAG